MNNNDKKKCEFFCDVQLRLAFKLTLLFAIRSLLLLLLLLFFYYFLY